MKHQNHILLHILKHNPRDGDVYITWAGETFRAQLTNITVNRGVDEIGTVQLSANILD